MTPEEIFIFNTLYLNKILIFQTILFNIDKIFSGILKIFSIKIKYAFLPSSELSKNS